MATEPTLFLVDDDPGVLAVLAGVARRAGFEVAQFESGPAALAALGLGAPDAALVDVRMPAMDGLFVLDAIKRAAPGCDVVLMSGYGGIETAVEGVKRGATDYVAKPFDLAALHRKLETLRRQIVRRTAPPGAAARLEGLIGGSAPMQELFALMRRVAPHFTTALVSGETGTGKELVARALHRLSRRREGPFLTVNCSAIVETLFESEVFGHTRGAFTGALETRPGLFERADGGIVFLDEVGELPPPIQAKLLRVLETGEVAKVGARGVQHVDVRVIAATNRRLSDEVAAGRFRADLFYRLTAVEIQVPPLRERLDDLPLLGEHFVAACARELGRPIRGITRDALQRLAAWHWPGNVRELRNVLERACMLTESDAIGAADLRLAGSGDASRASGSVRPAARRIADLEREEIERALLETRGNKKEAARRLGLSRRALYRRLEKFGFRPAAA